MCDIEWWLLILSWVNHLKFFTQGNPAQPFSVYPYSLYSAYFSKAQFTHNEFVLFIKAWTLMENVNQDDKKMPHAMVRKA